MITVIEGQSLLDIATQEDGNLLSAFDWAIANNLSITDELVPGQKLVSPKSIYRNNDMANYFKNRNQKIATGITNQSIVEDYSFPGEFPFSF